VRFAETGLESILPCQKDWSFFAADAHQWAPERLTTIGQVCMAVHRQTVSQTICWAIEHVEVDGWNCERIKLQWALP